jgi:phosphohistidine phosphatase
MRIAIVRHGKAEPHSASGADRDRRLRSRGERQARWLAEQFAVGDWRPALILSSPYERAITTARIIQAALSVPLQVASELECDEPASRAIDLIQRHATSASSPLMLVGHNPQLSRLATTLVQGPAPARGIELRTGEAALLEMNPPDLIASATPHALWRLDEED